MYQYAGGRQYMVVTKKHLEKFVSVETQEQEIKRLKAAPSGAVLYEGTVKQCSDIIDTLIHMSGISYYTGVAGFHVTWYKR